MRNQSTHDVTGSSTPILGVPRAGRPCYVASPFRATPNGGLKTVPTERGVALILVMLSMLILSVLAATIVFTARSETFASANFKLDTQADYLAKAGIQRAINWFRSNHYQAILPTQANTYYYVSQVSPTLFPNLYTSGDTTVSPAMGSSPVQCKPASTTLNPCPNTSSSNWVRLIGYGRGSSNYPGINNTEATARKVATAFAADLNDSAGTGTTRITADNGDSGFFNINATMLSFQTVNLSPPFIGAGSNCTPYPLPSPPPSQVTCTVETWQITSKATWTGLSTSNAPVAIAEEVAIVQPIFSPTWGNALYGFCSVSMMGSAGTCTDAFNSSLGAYGGGNTSVASGVCDSTSASNVISTGAGVGANGGVTLGSNVTVGGNVSIGSGPSPGCTASGYSGSTSSVLGEVVNGPHIDPPPLPIYPSNPSAFPTGAPSVNSSATLPAEDGSTWSSLDQSKWPFTLKSPPAPAPNTPPPVPASATDCITGMTCNGSAPAPAMITDPLTGLPIPNPAAGQGPYLIKNISLSSTDTLNLIGGQNPLSPVYYDIDCFSESGQASIAVSGYVVLNILGSGCSGGTGLTITGKGISNGIACTAPCTNTPPEAVVINYSGNDTKASIGGNGAISAIINAPNASVSLGGGGANGYMVGSIQANNVTVSGGYPIHYDINLARVGGTLGTMVSTAYGRKKM